MTHQLTPSLQLTTEHSSSSYGIPVLVRDKSQQTDAGEGHFAYGPRDLIDYGGNLLPAARQVQRFAAHHPEDKALQEAAAAFCRQWPAGPQV